VNELTSRTLLCSPAIVGQSTTSDNSVINRCVSLVAVVMNVFKGAVTRVLNSRRKGKVKKVSNEELKE
jgi:hypothetical protein